VCRHRFVLPADDPAATEKWVLERVRAHGLHTASRRPPVSRLLTAVIVAAIATFTARLLAAAHV
jgi:hypothetical protein